jgi:uncharacterized protein
MFFDIETLERRKIAFNEEFAPGAIDFLDETIKQRGDLQVAGVAELIDPYGAREIRVRGSLRGEMEVLCARCLDPIRMPVSCAIDLFYRPMTQIAREEEVEIQEAETEVGFYEGRGIELADVVREQVTIELPMRALCREDCKGICPYCGANRNREVCMCQETFADPRWEVLRRWKH